MKHYSIVNALPDIENILYKKSKFNIVNNETIFLAGDIHLNGSLNAAMISGEKAAKMIVEKILNHPYAGLKIVYWEQNNQSAWILEEIGKEHPITFGIVVANGKIKTAKVLEFREIRGWEIKYPAFTRQFIGASLRGYDLDSDRLFLHLQASFLLIR